MIDKQSEDYARNDEEFNTKGVIISVNWRASRKKLSRLPVVGSLELDPHQVNSSDRCNQEEEL